VLTAREQARAGRHAPLLDAPGSACFSGSWAPPLCRPPARRPPPELCHGSVPCSSPPLPPCGISRVWEYLEGDIHFQLLQQEYEEKPRMGLRTS